MESNPVAADSENHKEFPFNPSRFRSDQRLHGVRGKCSLTLSSLHSRPLGEVYYAVNLYICVAVVVVPHYDVGLISEQLKIQQGFGGLLPCCLPDTASSTQLLIIACFQERKLQTEFVIFDFPLCRRCGGSSSINRWSLFNRIRTFLKIPTGHIAANTIRLLISGFQVGGLIGVSGQNIGQLRSSSGVQLLYLLKISFHFMHLLMNDRVVQMSRDIPAVLRALMEIGSQLRDSPHKQIISISPTYNLGFVYQPTQQYVDPSSDVDQTYEGLEESQEQQSRWVRGKHRQIHLGGSAQQVGIPLFVQKIDANRLQWKSRELMSTEYIYTQRMRESGGQQLIIALFVVKPLYFQTITYQNIMVEASIMLQELVMPGNRDLEAKEETPKKSKLKEKRKSSNSTMELVMPGNWDSKLKEETPKKSSNLKENQKSSSPTNELVIPGNSESKEETPKKSKLMENWKSSSSSSMVGMLNDSGPKSKTRKELDVFDFRTIYVIIFLHTISVIAVKSNDKGQNTETALGSLGEAEPPAAPSVSSPFPAETKCS
ncbi:hypothetical protein LXL04_004898 [Taraxacum kok-saghyz]